MVEVGRLAPGEWPWLVARSTETARAHVDPCLRGAVSQEVVAARVQQNLRGLLGQPPNVALVARADGRPLGYLVVAFAPDELTGVPTGLFYDIFVEPSHRGTGISSRLTAAGEAHCRTLGVRLIRRWVAPENQPSLRHALRDGCRVERLSLVKVL